MPKVTTEQLLRYARGVIETTRGEGSVKVPMAKIVLAADELLRVGGPQQWQALMDALGYKPSRRNT